MKKNKLIELLNKLEGNPDIYLWNGYAEDFVEIDGSFVETLLVKHSKEFIFSKVRQEMISAACGRENISYDDQNKIITDDFEMQIEAACTTAYTKHYSKWVLPNPYVGQDDMNVWYSGSKVCYVINSKEKGCSVFNRATTLDY